MQFVVLQQREWGGEAVAADALRHARHVHRLCARLSHHDVVPAVVHVLTTPAQRAGQAAKLAVIHPTAVAAARSRSGEEVDEMLAGASCAAATAHSVIRREGAADGGQVVIARRAGHVRTAPQPHTIVADCSLQLWRAQ